MTRHMMLTSAMSSTVKSIRKRKKVRATLPDCRSETAATVGIMSWMAQGCRPNSATIHPASLAI